MRKSLLPDKEVKFVSDRRSVRQKTEEKARSLTNLSDPNFNICCWFNQGFTEEHLAPTEKRKVEEEALEWMMGRWKGALRSTTHLQQMGNAKSTISILFLLFTRRPILHLKRAAYLGGNAPKLEAQLLVPVINLLHGDLQSF
ncbi:hypothetical protein SCA6_002482 [Theobroma cacao]